MTFDLLEFKILQAKGKARAKKEPCLIVEYNNHMRVLLANSSVAKSLPIASFLAQIEPDGSVKIF